MKREQGKREEVEEQMKKAKRFAWITIGYLFFDMAVLYITMQSSQAMKAAWMEDLLYLIPSVSFLIASKVSKNPPNKEFRFGYDRAYSVGFVISSFALLAIGSYVFIDSLMKLVNKEIVTIGSIQVFGETVWFGWFMMLAIGYSILPVYYIGQQKLKLAKKVNIAILYVDGKGQKADWLTSVAVLLGIVGMGFGIWWADAVAAIIIAIDILSDAAKSIKAAISESMDRTPMNPSLQGEEQVVVQIEKLVKEQPWIENFLVRLRKSGNKTKGEVLVIPSVGDNLKERVMDLTKKILDLDWEITDVVVSPVNELPEVPQKKKL